MFNPGKKEIMYIGKLTARFNPLGIFKTEIYPISDLNLVNKNAVLALIREEEALIRKADPSKTRNHLFPQNLEKDGPTLFESYFYDQWNDKKKSGFISFEIFDEAKLRENGRFM